MIELSELKVGMMVEAAVNPTEDTWIPAKVCKIDFRDPRCPIITIAANFISDPDGHTSEDPRTLDELRLKNGG